MPADHDKLWDTIRSRSASASRAAAQGVSVGLAYHLGVDATLQPAAYHDLPFPAPIEIHQTIMGSNATAEVLDVGKKGSVNSTLSSASANAVPKKKRDIAAIAVTAVGVIAWFLT